MSKLSATRALRAKLEQIAQEIAILEETPEFKLEVEFENKLFALLDKYNVSAETAIQILNPESVRPVIKAVAPVKAKAKRPRSVNYVTYVNPHTNEQAEVGSLRQLPVKEWCDKYGSDTVRSWAA